MSDPRPIDSDENLDIAYAFKNSRGPCARDVPDKGSPTLVSLTSNRPAAAASIQEKQFMSIPSTAVVEDSDTKNQNKQPSELELKSGQKKGARAKPSSALLQAKMNARKQKPAVSPPPVVIKDPLQPARDIKDCIRKGTGVVYDMRMVEHRNVWDPTHPEKPERFTSIIQRCLDLGLLDRCQSLPPRFANLEEILPLHSADTINKLNQICTEDVDQLEEFASQYDCVYFHQSTFDLALLACGSTIDLVRNVVDGKIHNGMAIVRPPGHHAMKDEYCGYCYFNNVAVAAHQVLAESTDSKILIVDFDVHHGQATQQMFYNDKRVLYFSTHRYEHGTYWPNLEESNYNWIGDESGLGFNCNIPLNTTGLENVDFLTVWHKVLLPMAYEFEPDLVIVSAGFDAALGCPEGMMRVTPQCYPHLLWPLMGLAKGKVAVVLEGGYCLKSLAEGAALTLRALLGDPCPLIPQISSPNPILVDTILNATSILGEYWQQLGIMKSVGQNEFEMCLKSGKGYNPTHQFDWTEQKPTRFPTRDSYPYQSEETRVSLDRELDRLILTTSLAVAKHRVGLVYDDLMLKHKNTLVAHPECPERISNIFACHVSFGLVERCHRIEAREATTEELGLIHSKEHILKMRNSARLGSSDLCSLQERYNSIFLNSSSYSSALLAAGSVLNIVDSVMSGTCQAGVAIVRPPGHHAEEENACGFCLFNNVSLAAKYAIQNHGLKRILIVDWDVHHGNGIQHMFESDPKVLYISIHRYDNGSFFPCSTDADYRAVGNRQGEGFTVNIPWNKKGMGDAEYLAAFTNIVLPIAYEYAPELVLVSAGFDAAQGDPLGGCRVSPEGYAHMTHLLSSLANGKVILALEGGYNLTSISYSMSLCTKALLGDPIPPLRGLGAVDPIAIESIRNVLQIHSNYWTVLEPFQRVLPSVCPVKPDTYRNPKFSTPVSEVEVSLLLEKLEIKDETSPQISSLDLNANPSVAAAISSMMSIPDPPTSAGEPSLSMPTITPTSLQTGAAAAAAAAATTVATDGMSVGGGEMSTGGVIDVIPHWDEEAAAVPAESQEPEPEGAVGGSIQMTVEFSLGDEASSMFAVQPLTWCPHLVSVNPVPKGGIDVAEPCEDCRSTDENWICLSCYSVRCSRYVRCHMVNHAEESGHNMALSFSDFSVWCFSCDSYVDCLELDHAKGAAYQSKFGQPLPRRD